MLRILKLRVHEECAWRKDKTIHPAHVAYRPSRTITSCSPLLTRVCRSAISASPRGAHGVRELVAVRVAWRQLRANQGAPLPFWRERVLEPHATGLAFVPVLLHREATLASHLDLSLHPPERLRTSLRAGKHVQAWPARLLARPCPNQTVLRSALPTYLVT